MPQVSVVMPEYKSSRYLDEAVCSILSQTMADWELIVVTEPDTDEESLRKLEAYARKDARIRLLSNPCGRGISSALNAGLQRSTGEFIARMDADDVCFANRLERQTQFMRAHPEISVCGSDYVVIGERGERLVHHERFLQTDQEIRCGLLFWCCIRHPTVMLRRADLGSFGLRYDAGFEAAEDYELWSRAAGTIRFANMPEKLLYYRWYGQNYTHLRTDVGTQNFILAMDRSFQRMGLHFTKEELEVLCPLTQRMTWRNFARKRALLVSCCARIERNNRAAGYLDEAALRREVRRRLYWRRRPVSAVLALTIRALSGRAGGAVRRRLESAAVYLELYGCLKTLIKAATAIGS